MRGVIVVLSILAIAGIANLIRTVNRSGFADQSNKMAVLVGVLGGMFIGCVVGFLAGVSVTPPPPPPPLLNLPQLPEFPWPPPLASSAGFVERRQIITGEGKDTRLGNVADRLQRACLGAGYPQLSFYGVPDGFALVLALEQLHADGSPLEGSDRWLGEPATGRFTLAGYVRDLVCGKSGHYRVLVFIATNNPFSKDDVALSKQQAEQWAAIGSDALPNAMRRVPYTDNYICSILIYEFEQINPKTPAALRMRGALSSQQHLEKSGILAHLESQT
jgi:hypothetical protein